MEERRVLETTQRQEPTGKQKAPFTQRVGRGVRVHGGAVCPVLLLVSEFPCEFPKGKIVAWPWAVGEPGASSTLLENFVFSLLYSAVYFLLCELELLLSTVWVRRFSAVMGNFAPGRRRGI